MECAKSEIFFPTLCFTKPGIYNYTMCELTPPNEIWQTDYIMYRAIITVTHNNFGDLEADVRYPDGFPTFTNCYCPPPPCDDCCCCKLDHCCLECPCCEYQCCEFEIC